MATVVSHAMRRFASSPDANYSSCGVRSENSRLSWSSESPSALGRSMRYADPWLYDSLRAPNGLLLAPALVLCSCSDYLNGTKRSSKKSPTTCKKCKGTRIPISNGESKFGTMRCFPTASLAQTPTRAGTVRVTSSSRPSILPTADPYDLMRRSRLSVAEKTGSQFRARSVSPNKARNNESRSSSATRHKSQQKSQTKYSTVGRRSILECNVNPYELLSEPSDSSITLVNGQRIRVRPQIIPPEDYEDVQVRKSSSSQIPKLSKIKTKTYSKSNEKESECNRFKSILKKPTTTFSDTDSSYGPERSPSPAYKSGSHFYLPLPVNSPRKKVQFLVDSVRISFPPEEEKYCEKYTKDILHENEYDSKDESQEIVTSKASAESKYEDVQTEKQKKPDIMVRKIPYKLRRSESERYLKEETKKVIFHDSMALRNQQTRTDTRIVFTEEDLERLDGITNSKLGKTRPTDPPPKIPIDKKTETFEVIESIEKKRSKNEENVEVDLEKSEELEVKAEQIEEKEISGVKDSNENTKPEEALNENKNYGDKIEEMNEEMPPSAPPRKRSKDNKQSIVNQTINVVSSPIKEVEATSNIYESVEMSSEIEPSITEEIKTTEIEPPIEIITNHYERIRIKESTKSKVSIKTDYAELKPETNRTILQINPIESVHKLKIKNEFPETNNVNTISISDNSLGKTSIMINGDDCYSTIKVCDEIPLYHSSVVVKDSGIVIENKNKSSSSVYITGNFVNTFNPIENTEKKEEEKKVYFDVETKEITNDDEVVLREKNISNLDILKCLSDPVEAVRRNLVPHVCGKSEGTKRPRDIKTKLVEPLSELQLLSEEEKVKKFIEESFIKLRNNNIIDVDDKDVSSEHSSSTQYEIMDHGSECYTDHSNRSSITEEELNARTKFYELLADSAIVEVSENEDHHYESIKINPDPIYEEIEIPPPLPTNPPPSCLLDDLQLDKEYTTRSIFEGASKYDILSYLVDAKERGIVPEDSYTYNFGNAEVVIEEENKDNHEIPYNRVSHMSTVSDSSEDSSLVMSCSLTDDKTQNRTAEVERNDSGVGSETSKSSLSKYRTKPDVINTICEDCEAALDSNTENEPLICRKCVKKRTERKEIITEIVETEEKYSRDLQIILEEFYQPMLVAGLLTSDQLSAIFLNAEELLENSQALAERLRDAVEIAVEQGDEDLQTVNIGKLFLEAAPMLHGFETYCVRQGPASLLLASLEKEKELLRIFLRVSQMENTVLRRMNLNSFLMVPVQRVTKYPLLLARLYKVTPNHHETRDQLKEAQHKIELHLSHMNSETKDVPSKLWRRISSIPGRRSSSEMDLVNIKLRKIAVDVLEWNHDEAKFALEGRLLFTQPTDNNWRKGRTIKLTPVNALLVTNGKSTSTRTDPTDESLVFSRQAGIRDAALLLVRDKNGRYTLLREPLYLDRCVIAADPAWQSYFEVQELLGKDTFIFKAEDEDQTKIWYKQLQYYAQGMGAWRKRRNALANIMINGMGLRS